MPKVTWCANQDPQTQTVPLPDSGRQPTTLSTCPAPLLSSQQKVIPGASLTPAFVPGAGFLSAPVLVTLGSPKLLPYRKMPCSKYSSSGQHCHPPPSLGDISEPLISQESFIWSFQHQPLVSEQNRALEGEAFLETCLIPPCFGFRNILPLKRLLSTKFCVFPSVFCVWDAQKIPLLDTKQKHR